MNIGTNGPPRSLVSINQVGTLETQMHRLMQPSSITFELFLKHQIFMAIAVMANGQSHGTLLIHSRTCGNSYT